MMRDDARWCQMMPDDDDDDDDDNDDYMILNIRAKNHTSARTIVPWTVIFILSPHLSTQNQISSQNSIKADTANAGQLI